MQGAPIFKQQWPCQVFSLFHPFNMSDVVDEHLRDYFGTRMPFLNFKLGIQGVYTP
jgi:hypothetical protein